MRSGLKRCHAIIDQNNYSNFQTIFDQNPDAFHDYLSQLHSLVLLEASSYWCQDEDFFPNLMVDLRFQDPTFLSNVLMNSIESQAAPKNIDLLTKAYRDTTKESPDSIEKYCKIIESSIFYSDRDTICRLLNGLLQNKIQ